MEQRKENTPLSKQNYSSVCFCDHQYVFSYHDGDVFGCVADIGWITGHSYVVYGPLANGGTTVLFESTPIYPDPGMNRIVTKWKLLFKTS